ncbi:hypothetical protein [Streptomyces sp. NPDC059828]|uniref:hypothetical protein n=1 Tax=Streptomyces sp. NPDC059828 TaxID=3346965 RepID=UPI003658AC72
MSLMDRLLVAESAALTLGREANRAAVRGTGARRAAEAGRRRCGSGSERPWTRSPRASTSDCDASASGGGHSVDATHPPTHLRRACLLVGPSHGAAVVLDDDRGRRIAAELAGARASVARRIVRDGFGG